MIPVGAVLFSLLVGLSEKYANAPNVIEGGAPEALKGGDYTGYKRFWGTLLSSFFSLFSGASVGPEGPSAFSPSTFPSGYQSGLNWARPILWRPAWPG